MEKNLKKFKRMELLRLLESVSEKNEELITENNELRKKAQSSRSQFDRATKVGSIAEAALKANGYFEAVQRSADDYLREIKRIHEQVASKAPAQVRQQAQQSWQQESWQSQRLAPVATAGQAVRSLPVVQPVDSQAKIQEAQARANAILNQANAQAQAIVSNARSQAQSIVGAARTQSDSIIADANRRSRDIVSQANRRADSIIEAANGRSAERERAAARSTGYASGSARHSGRSSSSSWEPERVSAASKAVGRLSASSASSRRGRHARTADGTVG